MLLRSILTSYYATITRSIVNAAPKAIMLHMLRATENGLYAGRLDRPIPQPSPPPCASNTTSPSTAATPAIPHRYAFLFDRLGRLADDGLLDEPPEMDAKRRADVELLSQLRSARRALEALA